MVPLYLRGLSRAFHTRSLEWFLFLGRTSSHSSVFQSLLDFGLPWFPAERIHFPLDRLLCKAIPKLIRRQKFWGEKSLPNRRKIGIEWKALLIWWKIIKSEAFSTPTVDDFWAPFITSTWTFTPLPDGQSSARKTNHREFVMKKVLAFRVKFLFVHFGCSNARYLWKRRVRYTKMKKERKSEKLRTENKARVEEEKL